MATRRRIRLFLCLALAGILFYTWPFFNSLLRPSADQSRLLAEDTLQAACDSTQDVLWSLLGAYEYELKNTSEWNAMDHSSTKLGRLQASLDNPRQGPSHRNVAFREFFSPPSVRGRHANITHRIDLCGSIAGKRITMIGGEHIYRLHLLFLRHQESAEGKPFPCQYHEFCTHHHICLSYQHIRNDTPPLRYVKPPTTRELVETESAVINYMVSDTLFTARNESSWEYTLPFVDPMTGVRLRETPWLAAARKANIVILGRGPVGAPGETYTGNWSFLRRVPDYVDESRVATAGEYKSYDDVDVSQAVPRSLEIVNAAVHLTVSRFLPDLFQLLWSLRREVRPSRRKLVVWPSHWYHLPGRGVARTVLLRPHVPSKVLDTIQRMLSPHRQPRYSVEHVVALQLSALIRADAMHTALLEDPWTLLFNTQGEELLPRYGIVFLPLDVPWVEDTRDRVSGDGYFYGADVGIDVNWTAAVGEAFLTGLGYVLEYLE